MILRAGLGAMVVDDFDALPPELRFFAGGDRSIRGFDYQEIGDLNAAGEVIGGEYQAIASAEYEHYFLPKWGAAIFVDAGDAFTQRFDANVFCRHRLSLEIAGRAAAAWTSRGRWLRTSTSPGGSISSSGRTCEADQSSRLRNGRRSRWAHC